MAAFIAKGILDNVAPALSGRFFAPLVQGKNPAQALRRTKLDLGDIAGF